VNFGDEHYVKVFTRETATILAMSWQARALWHDLLLKFSRAGILECGPMKERGLALIVKMPIEVVRPALRELIDLECVRWTGAFNRVLEAPRFNEAQESKKERGVVVRDYRERIKATLHAESVRTYGQTPETARSESDQLGPSVTACDPPSPSPSPTPTPEKQQHTSTSSPLPEDRRQEASTGSALRAVPDRVQSAAVASVGSPPSPSPNDPPPKSQDPGGVLLAIWNDSVSAPIPQARGVTDKRRRAATARWAENPSREYWIAVARRVSASRFCRGQVERRDEADPWRATFDWFLRPDTHVKVMEGHYDDRQQRSMQRDLEVVRERGHDPYEQQIREDERKRAAAQP
jgi:hypothetical protein